MAEKKTWSKPVEELLATHETFRRLGFPAEELFVDMFNDGHVQFALRHQGETFTIDIGRVPDKVGFQKEWREACAWWNGDEATQGERMAVYQFSTISGRHAELLTALQKRKLWRPGAKD